MNRSRLIPALVFFNLAVFVLTVAFLPRAGSFSWDSSVPFSYTINSRTHWEIAWLVLLASSLASTGIYLLFTDGNSKTGQ